jgi:hypothetical protein
MMLFRQRKQKEVHPPYAPDLAPAGTRSGEYGGLVSVPHLKSIMKGATKCDQILLLL